MQTNTMITVLSIYASSGCSVAISRCIKKYIDAGLILESIIGSSFSMFLYLILAKMG